MNINTPQQMSLFPTAHSIEAVEQQAIANLPITTPNQIIAILRHHENTILAGTKYLEESAT